MADVEQLLREYVKRQEAGGSPDPADLLEQADSTERELLTTLIDGYWMTAPTRKWDAQAARGSLSERVAQSVAEELKSEEPPPARAWANLRDRAKMTRAAVVKRLAGDLGVSDREEKVGSYYHELENGWLDADRVSPSVFASLESILNVSADWLRSMANAGSAGQASPGDLPVLARAAKVDPDFALESSLPDAASNEAEWDEVDRLFQGEARSKRGDK